jgi:hypothetical protein
MLSLSTSLLTRDLVDEWSQSDEFELIDLDDIDLIEPMFEYNLGVSTDSTETIPIENFLAYYSAWGARIPNPHALRDYLRRYPEIAELTRFVFESIYRCFDYKTQLSLEVQDDEAPDSEYLAALIRSPEYDDKFIDQMRTIREKYYSFLNKSNGWFLLTTDFCPPE